MVKGAGLSAPNRRRPSSLRRSKRWEHRKENERGGFRSNPGSSPFVLPGTQHNITTTHRNLPQGPLKGLAGQIQRKAMSIIEIIKERLHIEDIIGRYVPLTKTGKHLHEQLFSTRR